MALLIYPDHTILPGLAFGVKWSPLFFNMDTAKAGGGAEIDVAISGLPLHEFELNYEFLHDWSDRSVSESLEFKTLFSFMLQLGGTVGRFKFKNPDDYFVRHQLIGTGDGTTTTFLLQRTFGANGFGLTEPVGVVDTGAAFNAYLGDAYAPVLPADYVVNTTNPVEQVITFTTAPGAGVNVYVDMDYWYYCKFDPATVTFEKWANKLWMLQKVTIRSCRPGA